MSNFNDFFVFPEKQAAKDEIIEVLKKYNISIDDSIVDFLAQYNGCKFKHLGKQWLFIEDEQYIRFDDIAEFELIENGILYRREYNQDHHYYFHDCIMHLISCDWAGVSIGFAKNYNGKLYCENYQWYEYDEDYSKMLVKIGDSLEDVFSRLVTYDELPEEWK